MSQLRHLCLDELGICLPSDEEVITCLAHMVDAGRLIIDRAVSLLTPITAAQLSLAFPRADATYLESVAKELNNDLPGYGLDSVLRRAHFFAQLREESGPGLDRAAEGFQYPPNRLVKTFGYYGHHKDEAETDGYTATRRANEEVIANKAYAKRYGNGDVASGDGWKYRGRGLIQITFRDNYREINQQYGKLYPGSGVDFMSNPEMMETFPYSIRSAVCFWAWKKLAKIADHGTLDANVDEVTQVVNKNTDSYERRQGHFRRMLKAFQWHAG